MQPDNKALTISDSKNVEPITFFEKDADFVFIYKKTEKLASAIYMVTNLFSENEPMKWTLRKKISELVSLTVHYKDTREGSRTDLIDEVKTKVLEVVSLLEISLHGGLISRMNFSILKQEFSRLTDAINSSNATNLNSLSGTISESFFSVPKAQTDSYLPETRPQISSVQSQEMSVKRTDTVSVKDTTSASSKEDLKRSNRQNIILNLIRKKKELTIKDIAEVIKDCSEKTIQRELNSFIAIGTLKRTGVRRWSKYSLAES